MADTTTTTTDTITVQRLLDGTTNKVLATFPTSQYSMGEGGAACGLVCMNAIRHILALEAGGQTGPDLLRQMMSQDTVQQSLAICSSWAGSVHLEVGDIESLPLFENS